MRLTIAIPTYNRNQILLENLPSLLHQLDDRCTVFILDNASIIPVTQTLGELLSKFSGFDIHIKRHTVNIGAAANILRCIELCKDEWLWILGDDDLVENDAVNKIFNAISNNINAVFFNFLIKTMAKNGSRPLSFDTLGQDGFASNLDFAGNVNFMSVGIWNVPKVIENLRIAYHYAYSMSPTFVLLLSSLKSTGQCHFSAESIIADNTIADYTERWRYRDFVLGWNVILELPMTDGTRRALSKKMLSWHKPENVASYLLADAAHNNISSFYYKIAWRRLAHYVPGWFVNLRFFLYNVLFIKPNTGWSILKNIIQLAIKLKIYSIDVDDLEARSGESKRL